MPAERVLQRVETAIENRYSSTNQPFLMHETIQVTQRIQEGLDRKALRIEAVKENLLQIPAEESRRVTFNIIYSRLENAHPQIIEWIAQGPSELAKFSNLYLIILKSRLIREILEELILDHFLIFQTQLYRSEVGRFFERKQEQSDTIAEWTEETLNRTQNYLTKTLVDAGILTQSDPWLIQATFVPSDLRNFLKEHNQEFVLKLMLDRSE